MEEDPPDFRECFVSAVLEIRKVKERPIKRRIKTIQKIVDYLKPIAGGDRTGGHGSPYQQLVDSFDEFPTLIGATVELFMYLDDMDEFKAYMKLGAEFSDTLEAILISLKDWCDFDKTTRPLMTSITMPLLNEILRVWSENARYWQVVTLFGNPLLFLLMDLEKYDQSLVKDWSKEVLPYIRKLALGVTLVGDFSCQYEITSLLLHWLQWIDRGVGEKLVDKYFHMMESSDRDILLTNIGTENSYDSRIRNFLGVLNSNPTVKKRNSITSIPCKYFLVGEEMLFPPQNTAEIWVDFSIKSQRIHTVVSINEAEWVDINLPFDSIESYCITWARRKDGKGFKIPDFDTQLSNMSSGEPGQKKSFVCFFHIYLTQAFSSLNYELQRACDIESRSLIFVFLNDPLIEDALDKINLDVHTRDKDLCAVPKKLLSVISREENEKDSVTTKVKDEPLSPPLTPETGRFIDNLSTLHAGPFTPFIYKQSPPEVGSFIDRPSTPEAGSFIDMPLALEAGSFIDMPSTLEAGSFIDMPSTPEAGSFIDVPSTPEAGSFINKPSTPWAGAFIDNPSSPEAGSSIDIPSTPEAGSFINKPSTPEAGSFINKPSTPWAGSFIDNPSSPEAGSSIDNPSSPVAGSFVDNSSAPVAGSFVDNSSPPETGSFVDNSSPPETGSFSDTPSPADVGSFIDRPSSPEAGSSIDIPSTPEAGSFINKPSTPEAGSFIDNPSSPEAGSSIDNPSAPETVSFSKLSTSQDGSVINKLSAPEAGIVINKSSAPEAGSFIEMSTQEDRYSTQEDRSRYSNQDARHSTQEDRHSTQEARHSTQEDKHSTISTQKDRHSTQEDRYSTQEDLFSMEGSQLPFRPTVVEDVLRPKKRPCYAKENLLRLENERSQLLATKLGTTLSQLSSDPYEFSRSWDFFNVSKVRTYGRKKKRPLIQKRGSSLRKRVITGNCKDDDDDLDQLLAKLPARDKTLSKPKNK